MTVYPRVRKSRTLTSGIPKGRRTYGYRIGWEHGYWYGQCESVLRRIVHPVSSWPVHVLFVTTGKGFPYSPIDEAITEALRSLVSRLSITDGRQPVAAIASQLKPDIVLVLDGLHFDVAQVDEMRRNGIRTAVWFTDDPYYTDITAGLATHYDEVFTLERNCVEFYRQLGCPRVHHLPLGVNPAVFRPRNPNRAIRKEVCFVGSAYWKRVEFFNRVSGYLASRDTLISGFWWDRLQDFEKLKHKIALGKWMNPAETAATYNGAKIVINMHRAHDDETFNHNSVGIGAISPNPRTFEISACATLQLTDVRNDLAMYYTPGVDIETYASPEEMIGKIDYYLHHENKRREIAMNGMYRTMRDHTYSRRLETLLAVLFG